MTLARLTLAQAAASAAVRGSDAGSQRTAVLAWHRDFGHLECDVAGMGHDLRTDLDEFFLEARQRPVLDPFRAGPASA